MFRARTEAFLQKVTEETKGSNAGVLEWACTRTRRVGFDWSAFVSLLCKLLFVFELEFERLRSFLWLHHAVSFCDLS